MNRGRIPEEYREAMSQKSREHLEAIEAKRGAEAFDDREWYYNDDEAQISVKVEMHDVAGNPDLVHAIEHGSRYGGEFFDDFVRFTPWPEYDLASA